MSSASRQIQQLAQTAGRVVGALLALLFRLKANLQLLDDFQDWYRDFTGDHDRRSLLLTYALGGLLTALMISPFIGIVFPLVLGYFVREMRMLLHSDDETTFIRDPWRTDRPAFRDLFTLTVDGLKIGLLPTLFLLVLGYLWLVSAGLTDILTGLMEALTIALVPAFLLGLGLWLVAPAIVARYADHGRLGQALAQPERFVRTVILDSRYLGQFLKATAAVGLTGLLLAGVFIYLSPLLVVAFGPPLVFLALLQATDHFALGYKRAVGVQSAESESDPVEIDDDSYLVPFRNGEIATPDRDRSILALGETGSGKTEAIKLLAHQFADDPQDPFVVFDYKSDYRDFFSTPAVADGGAAPAPDTADDLLDQPGPDLDADDPEGLIRLSLDGSSHIWNIFAEAESEDDESDFEELGRTLFAGHETDASDPFFAIAARQAFVGVLKVINRDDAIENPTNADLVAYFEESGLEDIYNDLRAHDDLKGIAVNLDPETSRRMAGAVYGQIQTVISEVFRGDFRREGDFSIREYMNNPRGRTLLLDFPVARGETIKPIFRLLIDWAIRFGLDDDDRTAYFVLDEFATIPGLERIERLVNVGRAKQAYAILGIQAKSQLHSTYGRDEAESILSGLAQEVLLRPGDEPSIEHIRNRMGRHQRVTLSMGPTNRFKRILAGRESEWNQYQIHEDYPISEAELQQFEPGEAVVLDQTGWRRGRLYMLDSVIEGDDHEKMTIREFIDRVRAGAFDLARPDDQPDRPTPDGATAPEGKEQKPSAGDGD